MDVVDLVVERILHVCRGYTTDQWITILMPVQMAAWSMLVNDRWVIGELTCASKAGMMLVDACEDTERKRGLLEEMVESMRLPLLLRWFRAFLEGTWRVEATTDRGTLAVPTVLETCSLIVVAC